MKEFNKFAYEELITDDMMAIAKLVMKYSPNQLALMIAAVDLDKLQYDMRVNGAMKDEFEFIKSSKYYHHIQEMK